MDKFLTFAGTQPVYLGDVDFMQTSAANTFKQLARALMDSNNAILQGVKITRGGDNVTFSPGIVVLNGEILPFEGAILTTAEAYYFHVESTLSGARTFKNGESHDCYETRKAVINTNAVGGVNIDILMQYRLHRFTNAVYTSEQRSGFISTASLVVMDNICYLTFTYTATPGEGTTGGIEFTVTEELIGRLSLRSFPAFGVTNLVGGGKVIQQFVIDVSGTDDNLVEFNISCEWADDNAGSGEVCLAIPLFYE